MDNMWLSIAKHFQSDGVSFFFSSNIDQDTIGSQSSTAADIQRQQGETSYGGRKKLDHAEGQGGGQN